MVKSARRRHSCRYGSRHAFCIALSCLAGATLLLSGGFGRGEQPPISSSEAVADAAAFANPVDKISEVPIEIPDNLQKKAEAAVPAERPDVPGVDKSESLTGPQPNEGRIPQLEVQPREQKRPQLDATTWREDGRCGAEWLTAVGETPAECASTGNRPCCLLEEGRCGNTVNDCSCGKGCQDFSPTAQGGNIKQHHIGHGCNTKMATTILLSKQAMYRAAVLSSGQWRTYVRNMERLAFDLRTKNLLKKQDIATASHSHQVYLVEPLKRHSGLPVDYFLCVDQLGKAIPDFVTEAWAYARNSQVGRVNHCLKRVKMREKACASIEGGHGYDVFVRIRPDFFLFSELPDPRTAMSKDCVMARFRMAANIGGLTNEHLSFCFCGIRCCDESGSSSNGSPGFVIDDMVAVVPKKYVSALWIGKNGPNPFPTTWSVMPNWFETHMTKMWITHGVKVCPLALRGLPSGSPLLASHVASAVQCAYTAGGKKLPQTHCGAAHANENSVHKLTPSGFAE